MAFPTSAVQRKFIKDALENTAAVDLNSDTFKCALFTNTISGTFTPDTDQGYGSAPWNANEVVGTGYTAGGATCTSPAFTTSSGTQSWDANDPTWTTSTITARGCLIYDSTVSNYGIVAINFGADVSSVADTFRVQFHASGIWAIVWT